MNIFLTLTAFLQGHVFWILAMLPGVIGVLNHMVSLTAAYATRSAAVAQYNALVERNFGIDALEIITPDQVEELRPKFASAVLGALALTTVFAIGAALSNAPTGIGRREANDAITRNPARATTEPVAVQPEERTTPGTTTPPPSPSAAGSATGKTPPNSNPRTPAGPAGTTVQPPTPPPETSAPDAPATRPKGNAGAGPDAPPSDPTNPTRPEGPVALVYACYGAYVYTLLLVISRLNSAALSGKFLLNCAMRSGIALVFGFVAGEIGLFSVVTQPNQRLLPYFALGVFPTWAFATLRRRARAIFTTDDDNCDTLPLCLIDGLDDGIEDRLAEVGIWDVQHLATARPGELTLRTLYTFNRVADWINQAILVSYVKRRIGACRDMGVRSAIDLATLYADYSNQIYHRGDDKVYIDRATTLFGNLAQKTNMSVDALLAVARSLYEDSLVQLIWTLWQSSAGRQERLDVAKDAVLEAAAAAAKKTDLRFDPAPGWGATITPALASVPQFVDAVEAMLPEVLTQRDYTWTGTSADFKDLTRWDDIFNVVANRLVKRKTG